MILKHNVIAGLNERRHPGQSPKTYGLTESALNKGGNILTPSNGRVISIIVAKTTVATGGPASRTMQRTRGTSTMVV